MISLGTEILHSGVFWNNEFSEAMVSEADFLDVDGSVVIQSMPLSGGRKIMLEAKGSDTGGRSYFTKGLLKKIKEWEVSKETVTLTYGDQNFLIKVPANPLSVSPLRDYVGGTDNDIYYGTITLLEVAE